MKTAGHWILVVLAIVAVGCSGSSSNPDGSIPGQEGGTGDGPQTGKVGDPCDKDDACQSAICYAKTCRKTCTAPEDCDSGDVCATDDAKRLFCNTPTYDKGVGASCAVTGTCASTTAKCIGGRDDALAYCTEECKTDMDCPPALYCRELSDKKTYCTVRDFCARCTYDAQCGTDGVCVKHGTDSHCSVACTVGKTECPRFAECVEMTKGQSACVHLSGTCVGDGKLCQPCITKSDCQTDALCLTYTFSQESFCSQNCGSVTCPANYECATIPISTTESTKQCVPKATDPDLPKCVAKDLKPRGEVGDKLPDFAMVGYIDSNNDGTLVGEKLRVLKLSDYSATAKIILFNLSAGWCGPCQTETKTHAQLLQTYGPKGLAIYQTLFDSDKQGERPTVTLLDAWVKVLNAAGSVGIDPGRESVQFNTAGTTPLNMIVDAKTLVVLDKFNGYSEATLEAKIKQQLGL